MATDVSIRVGVDGEKEFRSALNGINSQLKNLGSEMKAAVSSMNDMDDAEGRAAKQADILGRSMEAQRQKISVLTAQYDRQIAKLDELARAADDAANGQYDSQEEMIQAVTKANNAYNRQQKVVNDLGTQINNATADLNKMEKEMRDIDSSADKASSSLDDLGDAADGIGGKVSGAFSGLKDSILGGGIAGAVSGLVQSAISGIQNLVNETMEYNKIMGTLEIASQQAGYSAEQTAQSYNQLYAILGDQQSSATALQNLQALGLSQQDLTVMIDVTIGAWAKYGDSIPIDSLAEAVNETIKTGTVTGTFADVLNWAAQAAGTAGTAEDEFNAKLQATQDPAERARLVMEELSRQGLPELAQAFRDTNPEIVAMNEANAHMQESMGKIGEALAPVVATVTEAIAGLLEALAPLGEAFSTVFQGALELVQPIVEGLKESFQGVKDAISSAFTEEQIAAISSFFQTLGEVILAVPFAVLSAAINVVVAAIQLLITVIGALVGFFTETLPAAIQTVIEWFSQLPTKISEFFSNIIQSVAEWASNLVTNMSNAASNAINTVVNFFSELPGKIAEFFSQVISRVAEWASNLLSNMRDGASNAINAVAEFFSQLPGKVADFLSQVISKVVSWASDMVNKARSGMQNVVNTVTSTLQSLPGKVLSIGKNIVQGLWNGISQAGSWLWGKITGWANSILSKIKGAFGIGSPSKLMRDEVGRWLTVGMAKGIEKEEKAAVDAVKTVRRGILDAAQFGTIRANVEYGKSLVSSPSPNTPSALLQAATAAVPRGATAREVYQVEIPLVINGKELYRATFNDLRAALNGNARRTAKSSLI